jgi:hypothetical protein
MVRLSTVQLDQIRDILDWKRRNSIIKNALEDIKSKTKKQVTNGNIDASRPQLLDLFTSINSFISTIENDLKNYPVHSLK